MKTPVSVRKPKHQAKWQANKIDELISNLGDLKIHEIQGILGQTLDDIHSINKEDMNELRSKIGSIFLESKSNSSDNKTFVPKDHNSRRWVGTQCQAARRNIIYPKKEIS